jgi:predicted metalloprotease
MGLILLVVLALVVFSCVSGGGGGDTSTSGGTSGGTSSGGTGGGGFVAPDDPAYAEAEDLVNFILDDVQDYWTAEFAASGQQYPEAQLTIFNDSVSTGGCGNATSAVGPFYCPADNNAYIDIQYMIRLQQQLGAEGDFSQAYILAHEIGHHVQNVLGTNEAVRQAQSGASRTESNALQVSMELQADCLAGMWARSARDSGILEAGDLQEGVRAASAVGDDAITGSSNQENFTHGSSAQRVEWFQRGFEEQSYDKCDTF